MKTVAFTGLAVLLISASSLGSSSEETKDTADARSPVVAERHRANETADRRTGVVQRQRDGGGRARIVTTPRRGRTRVFAWNDGTDYKIRVIEPPRDVDYKILCIPPDPNVDYKIRIVEPGNRHLNHGRFGVNGKTITIDPRRGRRRK
jgi:hypothetical protein